VICRRALASECCAKRFLYETRLGDSAPRIADYLNHVAEAARLAREYVAGMSQAECLKDRRTQQAVVLNLITIGEGQDPSDHRRGRLHTRSSCPNVRS